MSIPAPHIELIPLRAALPAGKTSTLDLLVRITPTAPASQPTRPGLNIGLVIDRSGSMSGQKIVYARQAAAFAVGQLLPEDRVSITVFDDQVDILVPSTLASTKSVLLRAIEGIEPGGSTALHEAWRQGGLQVSEHLAPKLLNRVILLSDGQANVGETNADVIATDVHKLAKLGVSTTTMGVGDDYNEDLMSAMAQSGDGNYYYIESPEQLQAFFAAELQGLMATVGTHVSLGLTPDNGIIIEDVLNDFAMTETKRYKLPNMVIGSPVEVVVRLKVPALSEECKLLSIRLAWDEPGASGRKVLQSELRLPVLSEGQLAEFPFNPEVQRLTAILMAARARDEAVRQLDAGNREAAMNTLGAARAALAAAPAAPLMMREMEKLTDLSSDLADGDAKKMRKKATYQSMTSRRGPSS